MGPQKRQPFRNNGTGESFPMGCRLSSTLKRLEALANGMAGEGFLGGAKGSRSFGIAKLVELEMELWNCVWICIERVKVRKELPRVLFVEFKFP